MVIRAALCYFLIVFAAGFLLALVRIPLLEPAMGVRWAELVEMPLMLAVIWWAGRHAATGSRHAKAALACGALALGLLLLVEFTLVLGLRGMSLADYADSRDVVSGTVYAFSLVFFALMPWWHWRRIARGQDDRS